jgi:transcriptional regulator with XRE-family HTH domain
MPARTGLRGHPADYLAPGEEWPHGELVADTPPEVRLVAGVVGRLRVVADDLGTRKVARRAGLSPQTISNLLTGRTYGDLVTVARLERALEVHLWGDEHVHGQQDRPTPPRGGKTGRSAAAPVASTQSASQRRGDKQPKARS